MNNPSFSADEYQQQLLEKLAILKQDFAELSMSELKALPELQVFDSPPKHFRMRAEFKMWHKGSNVSYAMYKPGEYKKPYLIEDFPIGSERINQLMPELLAAVNAEEILRKRLFQVEFLTTLSGEALITLVYHKALNDIWMESAKTLQTSLGVHIIGRSRGQKAALGFDHVIEE